ncbi:hypothetical protein YA33_14835 [Klebsiella aerogenes]|nr:hypothetical protein YA33_14835 [Klebsiella aerogenes]
MIEKFLIFFIYKGFLTLFRIVFYLMDTSVDTITNLPVRMLACILHCSGSIVSMGSITGLFFENIGFVIRVFKDVQNGITKSV